MSDVPEPTPSGVDGNQARGSSLVSAIPSPPMQSTVVADAVDGLVATHSRNMGGDVAAKLLAASMRQTSDQLASAHQIIADRDAEIRRCHAESSDLKIQVASLSERMSGLQSTYRAKGFCTFVGTALLGLAIELYKQKLTTPSVVVGALGLALLVFVLLPHTGGTKK